MFSTYSVDNYVYSPVFIQRTDNSTKLTTYNFKNNPIFIMVIAIIHTEVHATI